jgi:hypothetical protein
VPFVAAVIPFLLFSVLQHICCNIVVSTLYLLGTFKAGRISHLAFRFSFSISLYNANFKIRLERVSHLVICGTFAQIHRSRTSDSTMTKQGREFPMQRHFNRINGMDNLNQFRSLRLSASALSGYILACRPRKQID